MRNFSLPTGVFTIACGLLSGAPTVQAAIATWVSGTGSDTGNCPVTAPCRTFAFAHDKTNNNGAINVLSSGNFGPLTITKPISIVAQGVEAVINGVEAIPNTANQSAGIIIQAGANAIVSLRGLTVDLRGTDNHHGIVFLSGAALHVHDSVVRKATTGIRFVPASGNSELYVANSVIADSGESGILVIPSGSGGATVALDRVQVKKAAFSGIVCSGQLTSGSITATVRGSVAAGNGGAGIRAVEFGSGTTTVMIDRSAAVNNVTGIFADAGATIRIGDSTVTGNGTGLNPNGGSILSYETNKVNGNGTDGAPTSIIPMK